MVLSMATARPDVRQGWIRSRKLRPKQPILAGKGSGHVLVVVDYHNDSGMPTFEQASRVGPLFMTRFQ